LFSVRGLVVAVLGVVEITVVLLSGSLLELFV
jgi:hypothetical protein